MDGDAARRGYEDVRSDIKMAFDYIRCPFSRRDWQRKGDVSLSEPDIA